MTLADQIRTELEQALIPWESLLGYDALAAVRARVESAAYMWAAQLESGDDRLAAQTVIDLMVVFGDRDEPWWGTPLGQVVARSTGSPLSDTVSYSVAAAMLGVSRTRVQQLVAAGRLETGAGGSIATMSLLDEQIRRTGDVASD